MNPGDHVCQVQPSPVPDVYGLTGKWYGETSEGMQTPMLATREQAEAALARDVPCPCACGCARRATLGWPKCGHCTIFCRKDWP